MDYIQQAFSVRFEYQVFFTEHLFDPDNPVFRDFLNAAEADFKRKLLFVVDEAVAAGHPDLDKQIRSYPGLSSVTLLPDILVIPGGEQSKNSTDAYEKIVRAVDRYGIDRHSYIAAIGGGSVLDVAGYAAAVAHRNIRHIRIPTTVLSQNDSGVGVKNGINYFNKKNFLGTFTPPAAVFNDFLFLTTLSAGEWRSGMAEAVKVALIKDRDFFTWLCDHAAALAARDMNAMKELIKRCAKLHLDHIAGGDPFEMGSSRPLDFGHWSAHKTEQLSGFSIRHGEAVAMGIALDTAYSFVSGRLAEAEARQVIGLLKTFGFGITHPLMEVSNENSAVLAGLHEFREHLGGRLTIMLLNAIGKGVEVHELDTALLIRAAKWVKDLS